MLLEQNVSLKKYNTFGIDVKASFFVEIHTTEELKQLLVDDTFRQKSKIKLCKNLYPVTPQVSKYCRKLLEMKNTANCPFQLAKQKPT